MNTLITAIQSNTYTDGRTHCMVVYAGQRPGQVPVATDSPDFIRQLAQEHPFSPDLVLESYQVDEPSPPTDSTAPVSVMLWAHPQGKQQLATHRSHIEAWHNSRQQLDRYIAEIGGTTPVAPSTPAPRQAAWGDPPERPPWRTPEDAPPRTPMPPDPPPEPEPPTPPSPPTEPAAEVTPAAGASNPVDQPQRPPPAPQPEITIPALLSKMLANSYVRVSAAAAVTGILLYIIYRAL